MVGFWISRSEFSRTSVTSWSRAYTRQRVFVVHFSMFDFPNGGQARRTYDSANRHWIHILTQSRRTTSTHARPYPDKLSDLAAAFGKSLRRRPKVTSLSQAVRMGRPMSSAAASVVAKTQRSTTGTGTLHLGGAFTNLYRGNCDGENDSFRSHLRNHEVPAFPAPS